MRTLVTGCAGFIGYKIAHLLLETGHVVSGVDRIGPDVSVLAHWRLRDLAVHPRFSFQTVDILDRESLQEVVAGDNASSPVTSVIHLAAVTGVRASVEASRSCYETNVLGTLNLLELCRESGIRRFILASTSSVYGDHIDGPVSEEAQTTHPLSPYGASKCAAEALLHSYHHLHCIEAAVLRYFTVYGPAGRPDMSVFRFIRGMAEGEPITVYGDGSSGNGCRHGHQGG